MTQLPYSAVATNPIQRLIVYALRVLLDGVLDSVESYTAVLSPVLHRIGVTKPFFGKEKPPWHEVITPFVLAVQPAKDNSLHF